MSLPNETNRKEVLIVYEYFYPGFKAGGPVQSLINLILSGDDQYDFKVITTGFDLNTDEPYSGVTLNSWNDVILLEGHRAIPVFYASTATNFFEILKAIKGCRPEWIYLNGMFGKWTILFLLLKKASKLKTTQLIISPRGMLQQGALSVKPTKKRLFLFLFKLFGLHQDIRWHATDEQEVQDIRKAFQNAGEIVVASNVPKPLPAMRVPRNKMKGKLKMVFFSLITEKKNPHLALEALKKISTPICFHIYGPIKDEPYWTACKKLMEGQIHEIKYEGAINPSEVLAKLSNYDAMILPTKGENFGHAIYESLSVGVPVIVSSFTPWGFLQDFNAGLTVRTFDLQDWAAAIQQFIELDQQQYVVYSIGAYNLAKAYFSKNDFGLQYQNLFS